MDDSNDHSRLFRRERASFASLDYRKSFKLRRAPLALRASPREGGRRPCWARASGPDLRGLRILAFEGDADLRRPLALRLEACGAEVATPASCAEATLHLISRTWDVLLVDVDRSDDDGYALAGIARTLPLAPASIALSAQESSDDPERMRRAGFRLFVQRPFDPGILTELAEHGRDRLG